MTKLSRPLHPDVLYRDVPFELPLLEEVQAKGRLGTDEVTAIALAVQTMLPAGTIEGGAFVAEPLAESTWFSSALSAQCDRRL